MLNFRVTSIAFTIAVASIILLHQLTGLSYWWILPAIGFYKIFIVYGSASISSHFYTTIFCKGTTNEKEIAITFDDGPGVFTKKILSTLTAYSVPATFFVIGKNIKGNESVLKQIVSEGHTLGNHTFSHSFFIDFKNTRQFEAELNQTADAVFHVTGKQLNLFRPPYGVTTPYLAKAAKKLNYKIIGWNIRSLDTTKNSEEVIFNRVREQVKPGAILLFHDTSDKTNNVLKQTLDFAKEKGFKVVGLEQLLRISAYK